MNEFLVQNAEWAVPLTFLLLQFLMKLLVAEVGSAPRLWEATLEAPVEVGFLSLSFIAALLLDAPVEAKKAYSLSALYIVLLFLAVALWKKSPKGYSRREIVTASMLTMLNFTLTLLMLVHSISVLTEKATASGN